MAKAESRELHQRLEALSARVKEASLRGAWQKEPKEKKEEVQPWVWRWNDLLPSLLEAGEIVPIDDFMRMRTIRLVNPSQPVAVGTAKTFGTTIQHLNPGEITESHRHTSASLYFVIQGKGTFTTAEGEQQFMEPGDLLIQPSWTWHAESSAHEQYDLSCCARFWCRQDRREQGRRRELRVGRAGLLHSSVLAMAPLQK